MGSFPDVPKEDGGSIHLVGLLAAREAVDEVGEAPLNHDMQYSNQRVMLI